MWLYFLGIAKTSCSSFILPQEAFFFHCLLLLARFTAEGELSACRNATRSRGNPFLPACAGQKFFPPGSLALSRFSRRATVGACENRSAAPAAPSLLRPLDALGAAAPWGQN